MRNGEALDPGSAPTPLWWRSVGGVVMCGFLLAAGFYLLTEHTAHLWGVLPFLLLLSCPLMHLFHHHGHGTHAAVPPPTSDKGPGGA